jgi:hypothetical protein
MVGTMIEDPVQDIVNTAAEAVPLALGLKKWAAFKTGVAYLKTVCVAAGKSVPIVAVLGSGVPAISQATPTPPARPEEVGPHVPSTRQGDTTLLEGAHVLELVSATTGSMAYESTTSSGGYIYKTFYRTYTLKE